MGKGLPSMGETLLPNASTKPTSVLVLHHHPRRRKGWKFNVILGYRGNQDQASISKTLAQNKGRKEKKRRNTFIEAR